MSVVRLLSKPLLKNYSVITTSIIQSSIITPLALPGFIAAGGGMGGFVFPLLSVLGFPIHMKFIEQKNIVWAGPFTNEISFDTSVFITIVTWSVLIVTSKILNDRKLAKINMHNEAMKSESYREKVLADEENANKWLE